MPLLVGVSELDKHKDLQELFYVTLFLVQGIVQQFYIAVGKTSEAEVQVMQVMVLSQQLKEQLVVPQGHVIYPAEQTKRPISSHPA